MLDDMYREEILDHARSTEFRGRLEDPDYQAEAVNPLCGDQLDLQLKIDASGRIAAIRYDGRGCAISQAAASMLSEHVEGMPLTEARAMTSEDMLGLLGIPLTPTRIKCGLLAWRALQRAIPAEVQGRTGPA